MNSPSAVPPPTVSINAPSKRARKPLELASRFGFTTYFQGRLTSIPVTICQTTTTMQNGMPAAGAGSSTPCSSDTLSTFLSSTKSAEILGGAYLPILLPVWTWNMVPNALFIAPIAKVGFATPTGSTGTSAPTSTSTTTTPDMTVTTTTATQPVNSAQFYNFYSFGGRVGHFKLYRHSNTAPELLSYLDVTVGRFSNLDTLVPTFYCVPNQTSLVGGQSLSNCTSTGGTPGTVTAVRVPVAAGQPLGPLVGVPIRRWRINIEGLIKIPATPFAVGMSANIGQNLSTPPLACGQSCPPGIPATIQGPKDDLRFFIGAKFDLGKMLAKLTPL